MRLDGIGLLLAFVLAIAYGVMVDLALFARIFRYRAALVVGSVLGLVVVFFLLSQAASPSERAGFFKGAAGGPELVMLVLTSAVFLPFVLVAPFAQYRAMRDDRRWPAWITAWMVVQVALLPGFIVLAVTEQYYWQREYADGQAQGSQVKAGGLGALLERADQKKERIWGTGWTYAWPHDTTTRSSGWTLGLALGVDASAVIASNEPLGTPDRAALRTLMDRHLLGYAVPNIRAKLLWDALYPGGLSTQLAPKLVSEETVPALLERFEKDGAARLCPDGRMMEADRAALNTLLLDKGRVWNVTTRAYEMRADWASYPRRVERLCPGPK